MSKTSKSILIFLTICLVFAVGICRYITLNDRYSDSADYSRELFEMGEIIPFGENYLNTDVCFNGYSIRVDRFEIVDTESYLSSLSHYTGNTESTAPEKLALVYITLFNENSDAEGVMLTELGFHSIDNYATMDWDSLTLLNSVLKVGYGVSLSPGTSYELILPFALYEHYSAPDTWEHLDTCTFNLHITSYPIEKDVLLTQMD